MTSILVTGASSGIGRETALRLAGQGHLVFAAARRLDRLDELARTADGTIVPVQLDVRDASSIKDAVGTVEELAPEGLDVLVNNAGYSLIGAIETLSADDIRDQYETNVLGPIEVSRAFLPQMRAKRAGRIVNVSSVLGRMSFVGSGVYASTKFALEALSDALRMELAPFGISVVLVEPGFTATDIDTEPSETGDSITDYQSLTASLSTYTARAKDHGISAERVARVISTAALTRRPRARYLVPRRYGALLATLNMTPTSVADAIKARQLA